MHWRLTRTRGKSKRKKSPSMSDCLFLDSVFSLSLWLELTSLPLKPLGATATTLLIWILYFVGIYACISQLIIERNKNKQSIISVSWEDRLIQIYTYIYVHRHMHIYMWLIDIAHKHVHMKPNTLAMHSALMVSSVPERLPYPKVRTQACRGFFIY